MRKIVLVGMLIVLVGTIVVPAVVQARGFLGQVCSNADEEEVKKVWELLYKGGDGIYAQMRRMSWRRSARLTRSGYRYGE